MTTEWLCSSIPPNILPVLSAREKPCRVSVFNDVIVLSTLDKGVQHHALEKNELPGGSVLTHSNRLGDDMECAWMATLTLVLVHVPDSDIVLTT